MTRTRTVLLAVGLLVIAVFAASRTLRVSADGPPTTDPLWYSGLVLDEDGSPLEGNHGVWLRLYRKESGEDEALCIVERAGIPFAKGRFRLPANDCLDVVRAEPELFAELSIDDGTKAFPRTKVGAVPYALEAQRAVSAAKATGALAQALVPRGAIVMFAGACPAGWAEYTQLRGRFPRGEAAGQALDQGGSDDAILVEHSHELNLSASTVGDHRHSFSVTTSPSGPHSHGQQIVAPVEATGCSIGTLRRDWVGDQEGCPLPHGVSTLDGGDHTHGVSGDTSSAGSHTHTVAGSTRVTGQAAVGGNIPSFQEVVFCIKE